MSDYGVLQWLKGELVGASPLANFGAFDVDIIPPPTITQLTVSPPRVYIWPTRVRERLPHMGGGQGERETTTPLSVTVRGVYTPDDPNIEKFPALVDAVKHAMRAAMFTHSNIPIVDALTDVGSYLIKFAEEIDSEYVPPRIMSTNRPVPLVCKMTVVAMEQILP